MSLDPAPEALGLENEPPVEAMNAKARRKYFNRRRRADVMGQGQPATWRTRLIKVAVLVSVSCRRIVVKISGSWPYLNHFRMVSNEILSRPPPNRNRGAVESTVQVKMTLKRRLGVGGTLRRIYVGEKSAE